MNLSVITNGPNGQVCFPRKDVSITATKFKRQQATYRSFGSKKFKLVFEITDDSITASSYFAKNDMVEIIMSVNPSAGAMFDDEPLGSGSDDGGAVTSFTAEVTRVRGTGNVVCLTDHRIGEIEEVIEAATKVV